MEGRGRVTPGMGQGPEGGESVGMGVGGGKEQWGVQALSGLKSILRGQQPAGVDRTEAWGWEVSPHAGWQEPGEPHLYTVAWRVTLHEGQRQGQTRQPGFESWL